MEDVLNHLSEVVLGVSFNAVNFLNGSIGSQVILDRLVVNSFSVNSDLFVLDNFRDVPGDQRSELLVNSINSSSVFAVALSLKLGLEVKDLLNELRSLILDLLLNFSL